MRFTTKNAVAFDETPTLEEVKNAPREHKIGFNDYNYCGAGTLYHLKKSGKYGKPYAEGDYKYFFPTKVDGSGKVNKNPDANIYTVFYPGAFEKGALPKLKRPDRGYPKFAKDFDAFREYLQES